MMTIMVYSELGAVEVHHAGWHADMALPDAAVQAYWQAKRPHRCGADDLPVYQNEAACLRLARIEFMRRDVLNQAMRNTDNHARNTAVQRTLDGVVQLTLLFDFAPMFKDPELIARSCHWQDEAGRRLPTWEAVIADLAVEDAQRERIAGALADFAPTVARLPELARDAGVEAEIIAPCRRSIDTQAQQLQALAAMWGNQRG